MPRHHRITSCLLPLLTMFACALGALEYDQDYGIDGRSFVGITDSRYDKGRALCQREDGTILVAASLSIGPTTDRVAVLALDGDGALIPDFGIGGRVSVSVEGFINTPQQIMVHSSGRILIVGNTNLRTDNKRLAFVVALEPDGSLATDFADNGVFLYRGALQAWFSDLVELPDGSLHLMGQQRETEFGDDALVQAWLSSDGQLISDFGDDGIRVDTFGLDALSCTGFERDANGRLVVLSPGQILRLQADGSLDTTFGGGDGIATLPEFDLPQDLVLDGDHIYALSRFRNAANKDETRLLRLDAQGSLDDTFGSGGVAVFAETDVFIRAESLVILEDGSVLIGGHRFATGNASSLFFARCSAAGVVDTAFGTDGFNTHRLNPPSDGGVSMATMIRSSEGQLLATGTGTQDRDEVSSEVLVCRAGSDGSLDTSFATDGAFLEPAGTGADEAIDAVHHSDGSMVILIEADQKAALAKLDAHGGLDPTFGDAGILRSSELDGVRPYGVTARSSGGYAVLGLGTMSNGKSGVVLIGVTADGRIDTAFGDGGEMNRTPPSVASGKRIYLQNFGLIATSAAGIRILVEVPQVGGNDFLMVAYTDDGAFDTDFAGNGDLVFTPRTATGLELSALVPDVDGAWLISGTTSDNEAFLARVTADGTLDSAFGTEGDGMLLWQWPGTSASSVTTVAVHDGIRYAVGTAGFFSHRDVDAEEMHVRALDESGADVTAFGSAGFASVFWGGMGTPRLALVDGADRLLLAGERELVSNGTFIGVAPVILALDMDGSLATGFAAGGRWVPAAADGLALFRSMTLHGDGLRLAGRGNGDAVGIALSGAGTQVLRAVQMRLQSATGIIDGTTVRRVRVGDSPDASEKELDADGTHASPFTAANHLDQRFRFVLPPLATH